MVDCEEDRGPYRFALIAPVSRILIAVHSSRLCLPLPRTCDCTMPVRQQHPLQEIAFIDFEKDQSNCLELEESRPVLGLALF